MGETEETPRWSRREYVVPALAVVVALVIGLVVGLLVGHATGGGGSEAAAPTPTSTGRAVIVPDSCLAAATSVTEATELIREHVQDIRDFKAQEIIALLDQLEDLDQQARRQAATCTGARVDDAPATPTGTPSGQAPSAPGSAPSR